MSATLAHRGADRGSSWSHGSLAIASRISRTTPESLSDIQPVLRVESGLAVVADARIDNRDELLRTLDIPRDGNPSDSELITEAFARWGRGCVDRLVGDFAFAVWSARDESLFCARDPMGVKPFYYAHRPSFFAFASEIKALRCVPGLDLTIDSEEVAAFFAGLIDDRQKT